MSISTIPQKMLNDIKELLPRGWSRMIAKKLGYSTAYVLSVCAGRAYNADIIREMIAMARREYNKAVKMQEQAQMIINK